MVRVQQSWLSVTRSLTLHKNTSNSYSSSYLSNKTIMYPTRHPILKLKKSKKIQKKKLDLLSVEASIKKEKAKKVNCEAKFQYIEAKNPKNEAWFQLLKNGFQMLKITSRCLKLILNIDTWFKHWHLILILNTEPWFQKMRLDYKCWSLISNAETWFQIVDLRNPMPVPHVKELKFRPSKCPNG